jgi:integrase
MSAAAIRSDHRPATVPADPAALDRADIAAARRYAEASRAETTRRAYASDWRRFSAWCLARGLATLPADPRAVAVFLSCEASPGRAPSTIGRRLASIGYFHRRAGLQPPQAREGAAAIVEVMAGIRRRHGIAPIRKHAADADVLRDILHAIHGDDPRDARDRALLAFGMAGAFRRSELVALRLEDVRCVPEGLRVTIRRGKTDQEGAGTVIAIPEGRHIRPKALLETWLARAGISDGFLFRRLAARGIVTSCPMSGATSARGCGFSGPAEYARGAAGHIWPPCAACRTAAGSTRRGKPGATGAAGRRAGPI